MKRFGMLAILSIFFLMATFSMPFAQVKPEPKIQPKTPVTPAAPSGPKVTVPDNPGIQEFSANPSISVQGGHVTFRWRVQPGPGGSPINRIRLTFGAIEIHSSSSASGEHLFYLNPPIVYGESRSYQFVLTATNQIGRSVIRTVDVRVMSAEDVFRSSSIHLVANPREFRARQSIDFEIYFTIPVPSAPLVATPFEIPVEGITLKQGSRIAGRAEGIRFPDGRIGPPVAQEGKYKIRDTGFIGSQDEYVCEIAYRGLNKQQRFRIMPLVFRID
jgi:hypothetical protein